MIEQSNDKGQSRFAGAKVTPAIKMMYTPGPWKYEKVCTLPGENYLGEVVHNYPGYSIKKDDKEVPEGICCIFNQTSTNEANARLIAAAPELLDTLKEAVDVLAHMQHFYHGSQLSYQDMAQTLERWNAAIQKATSSVR
jgi:hypothetical protein